MDVRGNLWITDFGVALLKNHDAVTKTGELVGTLRYMSPEQAGAERPGRSSHGHLFPRRDALRTGHAGPPFAEHRFGPASARSPPTNPGRCAGSIPPSPSIWKSSCKRRWPNPRPSGMRRPRIWRTICADFWRISRSGRPGPSWSIGPSNGRAAQGTRLRGDGHAPVDDDHLAHRQRPDRPIAAGGDGGLPERKEKSQRSRAAAEAGRESLARARQVVAFLTQVSADEMRDTPEFLPVRHKLLTGALQYYQEFIDEHHDDPTIRAELDAASGKVKEILTALTAQQEYAQLMLRTLLLDETTIRRELGVTASQKDKLAELSRQFREQRSEAFRNADKLTDQERATTFRGAGGRQRKIAVGDLDGRSSPAAQADRLAAARGARVRQPDRRRDAASELEAASEHRGALGGSVSPRSRLAVRPEARAGRGGRGRRQIAKETERKTRSARCRSGGAMASDDRRAVPRPNSFFGSGQLRARLQLVPAAAG